MNSNGPIETSGNGVPSPRRFQQQANQGQAPQAPGWSPGPNPYELQDEQMEFMTHLFEKEVNDHNSTRSRLHRYLNLYMKHERGQCADRSHVRYLNMVIQGLQNQLLEEKAKRKAAEETQALLLRSDLDSFSCGYPTTINQNLDGETAVPPHDEEATCSPTPTTCYETSDNKSHPVHSLESQLLETYGLERLAHYAGEGSKIQNPPELSDIMPWILPHASQSDQEGFTIATSVEGHGVENTVTAEQPNKRKFDTSTDDESNRGKAQKLRRIE